MTDNNNTDVDKELKRDLQKAIGNRDLEISKSNNDKSHFVERSEDKSFFGNFHGFNRNYHDFLGVDTTIYERSRFSNISRNLLSKK